MTTVRNVAKTTATLIILSVGMAFLMRWCKTLSWDFIYSMEYMLSTKSYIGVFHGSVISVSFWLLLIVSGFDAIFRGKSGIFILSAFWTPVLFSLFIAVWENIIVSTKTSILWFWMFCYIGLIVCVRIAFHRISFIKGSGSPKISMFFQNTPSHNDKDVSIIDRRVLYCLKAVILVDWFVLWCFLAVYCIQYRRLFGL